MSPIIRSVLKYRGALLMALLQAAPVGVHVNENGRFALAIGMGGDRYEQETFTCDGAPLESRTVQSRTISGTVNVPLRGNWSVDGFGGSASSDEPVCADAACSLPPAFKGGFGGLRFRVDGADGTIAVGVASLPGVDIDYVNSTHEITREYVPTLLLRLGSMAPGKKHFRIEANGVPTPGALPMTTFGVGFTGRDEVPARGFFGLAIPPYSAAENGNLMVRGELLAPAGRHAALNFGLAMNTSIVMASGGIRVQFGRREARP
jgi:hypothetical protein